MKTYSVTAKTSEDSIGNTLCFYKEYSKIWIGYENCEDRGFTVDETKEIINILQSLI